MLPADRLRVRSPARARQRGAVLVVGLIMLLLVTMVAVAAMRMATTHVQVVGNEQFRTEAEAAAHFALDLVLNNANFTDNTGANANLPPYAAVMVSLDSVEPREGGKSVDVTMTPPECLRYRNIKQSELVRKTTNQAGQTVDTVKPEDASCFSGQSSTGVTIVSPGAINANDNSLCVVTLWDVTATAQDAITQAQVAVTQGIELRMELSDAENKCQNPGSGT
jgi:hypothetical protein